MSASVVVAILISGFFTGALARFAVPGPDPMPLWLTLSIGLTGSVAGAVVAQALGGGGFAISFTSLGCAIALVGAYRRFVQHRPIWGPDALRFPQKGLGVEGYRERLRQAGIDPDVVGAPPAQVATELRTTRLRSMLDELHREGLLDDEELEAKRQELDSRGAE